MPASTIYKERHLVERALNKLKHFRHITTRLRLGLRTTLSTTTGHDALQRLHGHRADAGLDMILPPQTLAFSRPPDSVASAQYLADHPVAQG